MLAQAPDTNNAITIEDGWSEPSIRRVETWNGVSKAVRAHAEPIRPSAWS